MTPGIVIADPRKPLQGVPLGNLVAIPLGLPLHELQRFWMLSTLGSLGGDETHCAQKLGIALCTVRNLLNDSCLQGHDVPGIPSGPEVTVCAASLSSDSSFSEEAEESSIPNQQECCIEDNSYGPKHGAQIVPDLRVATLPCRLCGELTQGRGVLQSSHLRELSFLMNEPTIEVVAICEQCMHKAQDNPDLLDAVAIEDKNRNTEQIVELQKIAHAKNGECLSKIFRSSVSRYRWRCREGHEWEATAASVRHGVWCNSCVGPVPIKIEDLRAIACAKDGEILNVSHDGSVEMCRCQCVLGHRWQATGKSVLEGAWCPACEKRGLVPLDFEDVQIRVQAKGGECLSKIYHGIKGTYRWQCARSHVWEATAKSVLMGSWCPVCESGGVFMTAQATAYVNKRERRGPWTLEDLHSHAQFEGGKCLSESFRGIEEKYLWCCNKGHEWEATAKRVTNGSWCPVCAEGGVFKTIQAAAHSRGGECLSVTYHGVDYHPSRAMCRWRCAQGHEWEAAPNSAREGLWCPVCEKRGFTLIVMADLQSAARAWGGRFLRVTWQGAKYHPSRAMCRWQCAQGHEWEALAKTAHEISRCPYCAKSRPLTLEILLQSTAHAKGGECLSKVFNSYRANYRWRCALGHEWKAQGDRVREGVWCPYCEKLKRGQ